MGNMKIRLIAPCGMNCNLCMANLRDEKKCPGCRDLDYKKPRTRTKCVIRNCEELKNNNWKYCSDKCRKFPCQRLRSLDKRYRTKYGMSMLENLDMISKQGIRKFMSNEKERWIKGNKIFCVHHKRYYPIEK